MRLNVMIATAAAGMSIYVLPAMAHHSFAATYFEDNGDPVGMLGQPGVEDRTQVRHGSVHDGGAAASSRHRAGRATSLAQIPPAQARQPRLERESGRRARAARHPLRH